MFKQIIAIIISAVISFLAFLGIIEKPEKPIDDTTTVSQTQVDESTKETNPFEAEEITV